MSEPLPPEDGEPASDESSAPPPKPAPAKSRKLLALTMALGGALLTGGGLLVLLNPPAGGPKATDLPTAGGAEGVFVGRHHYVVALPKDYVSVQTFKDAGKSVETVHFCKLGTDPTNFLNEGLYGQLGIVRLEVRPSSLAGLEGLARVTDVVSAKARQRDEKFTVSNLQIGPLRGIQVVYDVPFARVESYILGEGLLFHFYAGQADEIYRSILQSLRDTRSEL